MHYARRVGDAFPAEFVERENQRLTDAALATIRRTQKAASDASVASMIDMPRLRHEPLGTQLSLLARVHDLTILNAPDEDSDDLRHVLENALFESGRPAIVVPKAGGDADPSHIAIAWDGSARAARAVKDALPLLQTARRVSIVTIAGEKDLSRMAPGADLAGYLASHGVEATLATLSATAGDASARLRVYVEEESAGMIVMGAFVHSRFRQAILGGVTSSLLHASPVPLFMAY